MLLPLVKNLFQSVSSWLSSTTNQQALINNQIVPAKNTDQSNQSCSYTTISLGATCWKPEPLFASCFSRLKNYTVLWYGKRLWWRYRQSPQENWDVMNNRPRRIISADWEKSFLRPSLERFTPSLPILFRFRKLPICSGQNVESW